MVNCIHLILRSLKKQVEPLHFDDQTNTYIVFKVICVFFRVSFVCLHIYKYSYLYIQYVNIVFSLVKYFFVIHFHALLCIGVLTMIQYGCVGEMFHV